MFMKNILNIPDVKRRFVQDKLGLLKDIVRSYLLRLPFQSISSFGSLKLTTNGRPSPNLRTIIAANTSGGGGLCLHNNYFMRLQLESIGYNVQTVTGCFRRSGVPSSHCLTLVRIGPNSKSEAEMYLVDVGCGLPLHEPVPLNHLPYHSRAGGLNYRYERINDNNNFQRINEKGDAIIGEIPDGFLSPQDYTFDLQPITLQDAIPTVHQIYSNPRYTFTQHLYCFRYLSIEDDDFKIVCIRGTDLMLITKDTRIVQSFKDYYDLQPFILKYFPMIDPMEVDLAVENHNEHLIKTQKRAAVAN